MSIEHVRVRDAEVSWDTGAPDVLYLDRWQPILLVPLDRDTYGLFRGRARLGEIVFHDGEQAWGWCYYPRCGRLRPSRKLHQDAMSAIRGRVRPDIVLDREAATYFASNRFRVGQ